MSAQRLQYLFEQHIAKTCTTAEKEELAALALQSEYNELVKELITQSWTMTGTGEDMPEEKAAVIVQKILQGMATGEPLQVKKVISVKWWRMVAAACVLLVIALSGYYLFFNKPVKQDQVVKNTQPVNDIKAPAANRAMISLANGQKIFLDSAVNGQLASQDAVNIVKLADGQIAYNTNSSPTAHHSPLTYNTLYNPRGSNVIDMTLSDGSHVWLNAGSSVTYPVVFTGNERKVTITGEAYFEVTHDPNKPFYVTKGELEIKVLGTHFNVNAYDDEAELKVTLLEGSVRVKSEVGSKKYEVIIEPGQQAIRTSDFRLRTSDNVDPEQVLAWKDGYFNFSNEDLAGVMMQLSRWYDAEVSYEGPKPEDKFSGIISRKNNLSQVLKMLEQTKRVKFLINGKKIMVSR